MKRIVLIGHDCLPTDLNPESVWNGSPFSCLRISWPELRGDPFHSEHVDLFLAVAPSALAEAKDCFEHLMKVAGPRPILGIVPPEAGILQLVSRVAEDFVVLPVQPAELASRLARILGTRRDDAESVYARLVDEFGTAELVGSDPRFRSAIAKLPQMGRSNCTVLITGETGTGKEMCARAIHLFSNRKGFPCVAVDCGAFPDHLFENELFGHIRGAYTDAREDHKGLVASAENGTLFLDEIDALSPAAQAKLLRFLQERTYKPLGAERAVKANLSIIVATNRDLEACVRDHQFRADLFFRLNVLRVELPPLRDRRGDIEVLARHFLAQFARQGHGVKSLSPAALRKLALHNWPGNVRELYNALQRAVILAESTVLSPDDLPGGGQTYAAAAGAERMRESKARATEDFEKAYVEQMLRKHVGNITHAAREAGKDRRAFGRLVKKYNLSKLA